MLYEYGEGGIVENGANLTIGHHKCKVFDILESK